MEDNQVEVEILAQTITAQYGTLAQGDRLRTSPEFAKHLVEDAKAAKYTSARKAEGAAADAGGASDTTSATTAAAAPAADTRSATAAPAKTAAKSTANRSKR
jgi:hypothetical protein